MRKKIIYISTLIVSFVFITFLAGCNKAEVEDLDKPVLDMVSHRIVSWNDVNYADGYSVVLNGNIVQDGTSTTYYLDEDTVASEEYVISVKAYSDASNYLSASSDNLVLKRLEKPVAFMKGNKFCWYEVDSANGYVININGMSRRYKANDHLAIDLSAETNDISLYTVSESKFTLDSLELSLSIDLNNKSGMLSTPNVEIIGAKAMWNKVPNAVSYTVILNDVETLTTTSLEYLHPTKTSNMKVQVRANGLDKTKNSEKSIEKTMSFDEVSLVNTAIAEVKKTTSTIIDVDGMAYTVSNQKIAGSRIFNFGKNTAVKAISYGAFKKVAFETYYDYGSDSVYKRDGEPSENLSVQWGNGGALTLDGYDETFSRDPFDFFLYIVSNDTLENVITELVFDSITKTYRFSLDMKLGATTINRKEVMLIGGLDECSYNTCKLSFVIDSNMRFSSYVSEDNYSAKMGISVTVNTITTQRFSYFNTEKQIDAGWTK